MSLENIQYRIKHDLIPLDGTKVYFDNGNIIPSGSYRLRYDGGAIEYYNSGKFQINYEPEEEPSSSSGGSEYDETEIISSHLGFQLLLDVDTTIICPGDYIEYDTLNECEIDVLNTYIGNDELSDYIDFFHPGGPIQIYLNLDSYLSINGSTPPRFSISKIFNNKLSSIPVVYDYSCDNIEYNFDGANRNLFFHLNRSSNLITVSVTLKIPAGHESKRFEVYFEDSVLEIGTSGETYVQLSGGDTHTKTLTFTGHSTHDYLKIKVINGIGSETYLNEYSISVTSPNIDSPNKPIDPITPENTSINLNPLKVNLSWSSNQTGKNELILGWDLYVNDIFIIDIIGSTLSHQLVNLLMSTNYTWSVIPYTSSQNHPSYVSPNVDIWSFTTGTIQQDGYPRDQRIIDKINNPNQLNVILKWSMFPIFSKMLSIPPSNPTIDDKYYVGLNPTDEWVGHSNKFATWNGSSWIFNVPDPSDYSAIKRFGLFYKIYPRINEPDWKLIKHVDVPTPLLSYQETIDMSTVLDAPTRNEIVKIFNGSSDNILKFKIIAYIEGTLKNESCGVMFPHSYSGNQISHHSTKTQLYINLDGGYIGATATKFKVLSEFEKVWTSQPAPYNLRDPSRIAVDFNQRSISRIPTIWAGFRGGEGVNGLVQYDYYTGNIKNAWAEGINCSHGGLTRGVSIDYNTGDGFSSGSREHNWLQRHPFNGAPAYTISSTSYPNSCGTNYGSTVDNYGHVWMLHRPDTKYREPWVTVVNPHYNGIYPNNWISKLYDIGGGKSNIYGITTDAFGGIWVSGWNSGPSYRFVPTENGGMINKQSYGIPGVGGNKSGICTDIPNGNSFNVWQCCSADGDYNTITKIPVVYYPNTKTVSLNFATMKQWNNHKGWRAHGIAVDSDNNIWIAARSSGCYKVYQKENHSNWGDGLFTQGGNCRYPTDYNHYVYNQWDSGNYIGSYSVQRNHNLYSQSPFNYTAGTILTNPKYKFIAYDQLLEESGGILRGKLVYPYYTSSTSSDIGGLIFFPTDAWMYMYSDFTGQVMKFSTSLNILSESEIDYEAVITKTS